MYALILIFTLGQPSIAVIRDHDTNLPKTFKTLQLCQSEAARWRAAASNKPDPETGSRPIQSYSCLKVSSEGAL